MNPDELGGRMLLRWALRRASESSTWAGLALIAMVLVSDLLGTGGLAETIGLVVGGALVTTGPAADDGESR